MSKFECVQGIYLRFNDGSKSRTLQASKRYDGKYGWWGEDHFYLGWDRFFADPLWGSTVEELVEVTLRKSLASPELRIYMWSDLPAGKDTIHRVVDKTLHPSDATPPAPETPAPCPYCGFATTHLDTCTTWCPHCYWEKRTRETVAVVLDAMFDWDTAYHVSWAKAPDLRDQECRYRPNVYKGGIDFYLPNEKQRLADEAEIARLKARIAYSQSNEAYWKARRAEHEKPIETLKAEKVRLREVLKVFADCWQEHAVPTPEAFRRADEVYRETGGET